MQYFLAILGILFIIAFVIERWTAARWTKRERRMRNGKWWQDPPNDGPEGDY